MFRLLLLLTLFLACSGCTSEEDAWVFAIRDSNGHAGCLVAVAHLSTHPLRQSPRIDACLSQASAVAFESDPTVKLESVWDGYRRTSGDLSLADIPDISLDKLRSALKVGGFSPPEIRFLMGLHPVGVYRALFYGKPFAPKINLYPNIDIQVAKQLKAEGRALLTLEGMSAFYANEKKVSPQHLSVMLNKLCDLYLDPAALQSAAEAVQRYAADHTVLPSPDTSYQAKVRFNTEVLGLPLYSVALDVDDRNPLIAENIEGALKSHPNLLAFVGADHLGGPQGLLALLMSKSIQAEPIGAGVPP